MSNQNDKAQMLRAMLAGQPTKESQELALKTTLYQDKNNINYVNPNQLQEAVRSAPLPSANEVQISSADVMLANSGARPLPPVSENDIMSMLSGKKPIQQAPQTRQMMQEAPVVRMPAESDYFAPTDGLSASANQQLDSFDINSALRQRLQQRQINEQKQAPAVANIDPNAIIDLVEDIVYGILGQLVEEANANKMDKEGIRIKIGESIFSGKLEKALTAPKKPGKK